MNLVEERKGIPFLKRFLRNKKKLKRTCKIPAKIGMKIGILNNIKCQKGKNAKKEYKGRNNICTITDCKKLV